MEKILNRRLIRVEIQRQEYLDRLVNRIGNGSIKIITGLRRSGKSYLLNVMFYRYLIESKIPENRIVRFSFDSAEDLEKIGEDVIELNINKRKVDYKKFMNYISSFKSEEGPIFLLLDEIQILEGFEYVLNGYLSNGKYEIYVTGSNSKFLSKDVITEFRGRGDEIHVMPLSFPEFYKFKNIDYKKALDEYMTYGGLPRVVLAKTEEEKINYLKSLFETTYLKDIIERYNIKDIEGISDLLNIVASGISSLVNPLKLSNTFKSVSHADLSDVTISKYINCFEESFILRKVLRYNVKGKNYISTPYKLYFEDIGLRNARLNFRQIEPTHIMENIIYNELINRGYSVDVGAVPIRGKDENGKDCKDYLEIDFVVNKGSLRFYIQSAYALPNEQKENQEFQSFRKVNDSFKKIIVVEDCPISHYTDEGFYITKLQDFLLDDTMFNH